MLDVSLPFAGVHSPRYPPLLLSRFCGEGGEIVFRLLLHPIYRTVLAALLCLKI